MDYDLAVDIVAAMSNPLPAGFWSRMIATVTGCAFLGALVGAIGGLIIGNVGQGISVGIMTGAVVSVALIAWIGERPQP